MFEPRSHSLSAGSGIQSVGRQRQEQFLRLLLTSAPIDSAWIDSCWLIQLNDGEHLFGCTSGNWGSTRVGVHLDRTDARRHKGFEGILRLAALASRDGAGCGPRPVLRSSAPSLSVTWTYSRLLGNWHEVREPISRYRGRSPDSSARLVQ
jgi:hypothetical protein